MNEERTEDTSEQSMGGAFAGSPPEEDTNQGETGNDSLLSDEVQEKIQEQRDEHEVSETPTE